MYASEQLYQRSRNQTVLAACEIALALQLKDVKVLLYKGMALRRLDTSNSVAHHNKGNLLLEDFKCYGEAVIAYEQALSLGSPLSILGKEKALRKQSAYQHILNVYERVTRLEPKNASAYFVKG